MLLFPRLAFRNSKFLKSNFPNSKINYKRLGNILLNDVLLLTPNNTNKFVLKKYNNVFSVIKWTLLYSFTFYSSKFYISPRHRIRNELQGLHWSRSIGSSFNVYAPKVYDVIHGGLIIDFIEGTPIDEFTKFSPKVFFNHFKAIGSILSLIHSNNYSFGDCKAENIFYNSKEKKYYFIDFEQFIKLKPQEYVRKVWDVTELFFYLGHNFPSSTSHDFLKKVIYIFLTRYYSDLFSSSQPNDYKNKMFTELGKLRYILIYATFMSPKTFFFILKTIQEWKNSFRLKWSKKIHGK